MTYTFLHASDLHAGMSRYGTDPETGLSRDHASSLRVLTSLVEQAQEHKVSAIVLSGDQFDTGKPSVDAIVGVATALRPALAAGIELVILGGNHEAMHRPLRGLSPNVALAHMLRRDGVVHVPEDRPTGIRLPSGLQVVAMPWLHKTSVLRDIATGSIESADALMVDYYRRSFAEIAQRAKADEPLIALSHVTVDAQMRHGSEAELCQHIFSEPIVPTRVFDDSPVAYAALGHIHTAAQVSAKCFYAGSMDRLTFGDAGVAKSANLVTLSQRGAQVTALPLPARDLQRLSLDTLSDLRAGSLVELTLEPGRRDVPTDATAAIREAGSLLVHIVRSPSEAPLPTMPVLAEDTSLGDALATWFDLHPCGVDRQLLVDLSQELTR